MSLNFASRAGAKLDFALSQFKIDVQGKVCADLGCSTGGFTDCLLQRGAKKVYAVDTGYGVLDWRLRNDSRVQVLERTNALHVQLPEPVQFISIDVGWTKQELILPHALSLLSTPGDIVSLLKPHYEARREQLNHGVVKPEELENIVTFVTQKLSRAGINISSLVTSPVLGEKGKNTEFLFWVHTG